jgi:uncharacterized membrane protein
MDLGFEEFMSHVVRAFEVVGVAILLLGSIVAFGAYLVAVARGAGTTARLAAFTQLRAALGRAILLGLEVLVVADIVRTIVVEPTLESAATLGVIVIVRILLSFAIDVEVDGVAPWRKADRDARRRD